MLLAGSLQTKVRTALLLGLNNVASVAAYRILLRLGLHKSQRIRAAFIAGDIFSGGKDNDFITPEEVLRDAPLFGWYNPPLGGKLPGWHTNYLTGKTCADPLQPWWKIRDFDNADGDIKGVWELSRFGWLSQLAIKARLGDKRAVPTMNNWIADWCRANPPYLGRNWKCGQETSVRVMRLAISALILGQIKPQSPALEAFLNAHILRVLSTLSYARAQQNNHGTSESAAIFIAGSWLAALGDRDASAIADQGRAQLEERVSKLISPDGSFSQYSTNYHRLFLDTATTVELWRRAADLPSFSDSYISKIRRAVRWMVTMIDLSTGEASNIGANDGAHLLTQTGHDYCDYRPCVELASALFLDQEPSTEVGRRISSLFGIQPPGTMALGELQPPVSELLDDGGYAVLRSGTAKVVMRYPRFKFRPSHADAFHIDLWANGKCLLGGPGSYSYAMADPDQFSGTAAHNTIQFDDRNQMPRLGRFLYGDWLKTLHRSEISAGANGVNFEASYRDHWEASHNRLVQLSQDSLVVEDHVKGFRQHAILRWRVPPNGWAVHGSEVRSDAMRVMITSSSAISISLKPGWVARLYGKKEEILIIEARVTEPGRISSLIEWSP
jgi:hypothetical protein